MRVTWISKLGLLWWALAGLFLVECLVVKWLSLDQRLWPLPIATMFAGIIAWLVLMWRQSAPWARLLTSSSFRY
jgi:hypothetical protein